MFIRYKSPGLESGCSIAFVNWHGAPPVCHNIFHRTCDIIFAHVDAPLTIQFAPVAPMKNGLPGELTLEISPRRPRAWGSK